ncbi:hypothetical protein [Streptomyces sp. TRM70350]|uniref:hypothetical protein n=1 Tax=Streptomyces sp. TRM70350 TaxID=2856165 RepID=UPI001C4637D3|nr:hypothetical protein [Streptomyces sp. TRM70350]MBV7698104.1 hypothetical protein [Streptomyces sp. TRM70350]
MSPLVRTGISRALGPESNFVVVFPVARSKPMTQLEVCTPMSSSLRRKTWSPPTATVGQ